MAKWRPGLGAILPLFMTIELSLKFQSLVLHLQYGHLRG